MTTTQQPNVFDQKTARHLLIDKCNKEQEELQQQIDELKARQAEFRYYESGLRDPDRSQDKMPDAEYCFRIGGSGPICVQISSEESLEAAMKQAIAEFDELFPGTPVRACLSTAAPISLKAQLHIEGLLNIDLPERYWHEYFDSLL